MESSRLALAGQAGAAREGGPAGVSSAEWIALPQSINGDGGPEGKLRIVFERDPGLE